MAMIERVYGHFRNQFYQDAQARLDGSGQHGGFDLGRFERTNYLTPSPGRGTNFGRSLEVREVMCPCPPGLTGSGAARGP